MTFEREFRDFPADTMPVIPAGFADTSWHNDTMPSFTSLPLRLSLWVDYADRDLRELPDCNRDRFSVYELKEDGSFTTDEPMLSTNEWMIVVQRAKQAICKADAAALNAWYVEAVGYAPQTDSPSMSDDELRALCLGYFDEHQARMSAVQS
jgi:hypothetical protein